MDKQMILITGGAGYIGSHTNKELWKQGYSTIVLDNLCTGHRRLARWGEFVLGDLKDINQLRLIFSKYPISAVLHFAAHSYVGESVTHPEKYYSNNLANTLNLLSVMKEFQVKYIVFSSTCSTYGEPKQIPITESHSQNPINPYGMSKWMIERMLEDFHKAYKMEYICLRYFNAAGADDDAEIGEIHDPETHLIPLILDVALGKRSQISIFGTDYATPDGTCIRDYIHVTDLAQAHILALKYLLVGGESDCFNLGSEKGYSVKEVIQCVEKITNCSIPSLATARREGDPAQLISSSQKSRQILNWQPKYGLEKIIQTAWRWHKNLGKNGNKING